MKAQFPMIEALITITACLLLFLILVYLSENIGNKKDYDFFQNLKKAQVSADFYIFRNKVSPQNGTICIQRIYFESEWKIGYICSD